MPTKLDNLRSQLNRLQRMRAAVRYGSALCAPLTIFLSMLLVAFLLDWSLDLSAGLRSGILVAWIVGGLWSIKTFALPQIALHESVEDVALVVEQRHKIDTDLVAALQFERPDANLWGSPRLSDAVVRYVADFSPSLEVFEGFSYRPLPKRAVELFTVLLLVLGASILFPGHAQAFWNRFLLGSAHYPTKTRIEFISICGREVPVFSNSPLKSIRIPFGQPISFMVKCEGAIPTAGSANLSGLNNDSVNRIGMHAHSTASNIFSGEIPHIADSFRVRFHFGDASSDPAEVTIVPLPLVDIAWEVTPPQYAVTSTKPNELDAGSRQFAVLEGSTAKLRLVCSNKSLKTVVLTSAGSEFDMIPSGDNLHQGTSWSLPSDTPFDSIREGLKYEIQVVDQDDLSLEAPISGQIRLKSDRSPRIVVSAVTRLVIPTAQPKLDYVAGDDFGVSKITATINISREDGRMSRHEIFARVISEQDQPMPIVRDQIAIPLSQYELVKGDEIKVTLEVTDWRGSLMGQTGTSEPITFHVTDLNGVLAQTEEEDKKSAKQLDDILNRELGIGGDKKK